MAEFHQISLPMEANPQAPPPLGGTPQTLLGVQPQRAAPVEATQQEKPAGMKRRGRRKIPMQRIHDDNNRLDTFSKRRAGIFKKAAEISTLCGVDIGILIFSPAGKPYAYGVPNIELIADRFLGRVNVDAPSDSLWRNVMEAQRKATVVKLNKDCDQLSVYLQNLKKEGDRLMDLKKQTFDGICWWDTPVEDLRADQMQKLTVRMEEIKKNVSSRLRDLRAGASSTMAVFQPQDIQMGGNEGFGNVGDGGFGDFPEGGSSSAVAGGHGRDMQMGGNLGQRYTSSPGDSGGFGDWRGGGSTAAGIQGGGFQRNGPNGGLGGYGGGVSRLGDWVPSSSVQAGAMQMGGIGNGGNRYGGGFGGDFTAGASSSVSVQQGGMQTHEYGVGRLGGGDVAGGGIGGGVGGLQMGGNRFNGYGGDVGGGSGAFTVGGSSSANIKQGGMQVSSAVQPSAGSILLGGSGGGAYGGGVAGVGGLSDGWKPVNLSSTFKAVRGANSWQMAGNGSSRNFGSGGGCVGGLSDWRAVGSSWMQMGGDGAFGHKDCAGGSSAGGGVGGGGDGDRRAVGSSIMEIGGIGGFGYNKDIDPGGSAGGGVGGSGAGGALSSFPHHPNPMQTGRSGQLDYGGLGGGVGGEFGGGGSRFGDFTEGGSLAAALHPDQDQMVGTNNGASFYDCGGGFGTSNPFGGFLYDGGSKFI